MIPGPSHVPDAHGRALAALDVLAEAANERQRIAESIAAGVTAVRTVAPGVVELVVRVDVDTLQAIEDAAEYALPEAEPLDRRPVV